MEKKEGKLKGHKDIIISDLPGIYSLSPYSPEEVITRTYLLNEKPKAILNIVDATNLERNLYLTTQTIGVGYSHGCCLKHDGYSGKKRRNFRCGSLVTSVGVSSGSNFCLKGHRN